MLLHIIVSMIKTIHSSIKSVCHFNNGAKQSIFILMNLIVINLYSNLRYIQKIKD